MSLTRVSGIGGGGTATLPGTGGCRVHAARAVRRRVERARAEGAALQLAAKMGLDPAMVVHAKGMGPDFTFFIVYGRVSHVVDLSAVTVAEGSSRAAGRRGQPVIRSALGRKLVVVGACIGTDAHTVGIDAILNVKGTGGEGPGVLPGDPGGEHGVAGRRRGPVARAAAEHADAVLVSQVVTQRDAHLTNTREMVAAFQAGFVDPSLGGCWWWAGRGSTRTRRMTSPWTSSLAAVPRRAKWPATWCTRSPRQGVWGDGVPREGEGAA